MTTVFSYFQQIRIFVYVNFSQIQDLEQFHGKAVKLDSGHRHSPLPILFLIQEMRTRGFYPWCTDRPIHRPLSTTYTVDDIGRGGVADLGGASVNDTGGMDEPDGSGGAASSCGEPGEPPSTGINQQYLTFGNPFQDPELLESMRREWEQLPNWKSANIEGLTWEGTAEENARKYIDLVGVSSH